jgi:hypothetical protein
MGFEDIKNTARNAFENAQGNPDDQNPNDEGQQGGLAGKANDFVDGAQEQHGDKLGGHRDKANELIDGAQERFGQQ